MSDPVTKPDHYQLNGCEVKDVIWAAGHGESFFLGAAIKYLLRAGRKGDKRQDLQKAIECITEVLRHLPEPPCCWEGEDLERAYRLLSAEEVERQREIMDYRFTDTTDQVDPGGP